MSSDLFTVEEHELAQDIKQNASTLVSLVFSGNDVGLFNMFEDMLKIASTKAPKKVKDHRSTRLESSLHEKAFNRFYAVKVSDAISSNMRSCLKIAQNIMKQYRSGGNVVDYFKRIVEQYKDKLHIKESLDDTKHFLKSSLLEVDGDKKISPQSDHIAQDKEEGDILYHLDVATRHIDVLVDFKLIHGHEDEVVAISSQIQELAQRLRTELEARRTPYDERK